MELLNKAEAKRALIHRGFKLHETIATTPQYILEHWRTVRNSMVHDAPEREERVLWINRRTGNAAIYA